MRNRLLESQRAEAGGEWPETVAVVLWGTDNIKTYGESLAQVSNPSLCLKYAATTSPSRFDSLCSHRWTHCLDGV